MNYLEYVIIKMYLKMVPLLRLKKLNNLTKKCN